MQGPDNFRGILAPPLMISPAVVLELSLFLVSPNPAWSVEIMVGLPSSSPLNQSVGTDCPEMDQPQWPLLLLSLLGSASHQCTVSEAEACAVKWNLISPSASSCLSLCLYLPLAWCINPGMIFRSSDLSHWSSLSSFWAVLEFWVIAGVSLDRIVLCFSRYHQDQYLWQMINKTSCSFDHR